MLCCAIILQKKNKVKRYFPANTKFDKSKTYTKCFFLNLPLVNDLNFINNVNGKFLPITYGSSRVYFSINGIKHQKNLVTAGQTPIFFYQNSKVTNIFSQNLRI